MRGWRAIGTGAIIPRIEASVKDGGNRPSAVGFVVFHVEHLRLQWPAHGRRCFTWNIPGDPVVRSWKLHVKHSGPLVDDTPMFHVEHRRAEDPRPGESLKPRGARRSSIARTSCSSINDERRFGAALSVTKHEVTRGEWVPLPSGLGEC